MNIKKVLADRVLVKIEEPSVAAKSVEISGIIIPDAVVAKAQPITGEVIAVGEGFLGIPMTLKVGDRVLFGKSSGYADENLFGKDVKAMKEFDILAVIDKDIKVMLK